MAEKKRHTGEDQKPDTNAWMVTFSDLIMLLITFFVLLLSMSSLDTKKLREILNYVGEAVGVLEFSGSREITNLASFTKVYRDSSNKIVIDQKLINQLFGPSLEVDQKLQEIMKDADQLINITDDERGIVFSFQDTILFDSGKATIKKEGFLALDSIAEAIASCPNDILIMGHTDNVPIRNKLYGSNWELSASRGLSVLEYLVKIKGLSPERFSVGGYGPSRPIYPNDALRNRARNRRVEIIFKHLQGV